MFLRSKTRKKDGKEHRYWSVVENRCVADGRVVQRQVLYLGEINDAQQAAWCRSIAVFDQDRAAAAQVALFPEDRRAPELACEVVQVKLSGLQRRRARQWGACWLACELLYNRYYETFDAFRDACKRFFKGLDAFAPRLRTLLTEKFQIIGDKKPKIAIG